jgi:hypothetical protein
LNATFFQKLDGIARIDFPARPLALALAQVIAAKLT